MVLLLFLQLRLGAVVVVWNEPRPSEAGNAFTLPAECVLLAIVLNWVVVCLKLYVRTLPWIFHKLLSHVGSQSLVLEERGPHLYVNIVVLVLYYLTNACIKCLLCKACCVKK
jgi:hypothetical protein